MNTESVVHEQEEDEPVQPLVQWFPPGGMAQAAPAAAAGVAAVVLGALVYAGFALAQAAVRGRGSRELVLDRLVVRRLTVLED